MQVYARFHANLLSSSLEQQETPGMNLALHWSRKTVLPLKNIGFHDKKQLSLLTCLHLFLEHLLSPVISCFK